MSVDELLAINERIPRRLYFNKQRDLTDSQDQLVDAQFCGVSEVAVFPYAMDCSPPVLKKDFLSQLGRGELRGMGKTRLIEAKLILGRDFSNFDASFGGKELYCDIQAMLYASNGGMNNSNAYFLGPNTMCSDGRVSFSRTVLAYFKIPSEHHKALQINPDEEPFKTWIHDANSRNLPCSRYSQFLEIL